jgi:poly-beta-hydroxyalkanoate depolymerase
MTYEEAAEHERFIDKLLSMADLPDGYYWTRVEAVDDEHVVAVRFSPHEEDA